MRCAICDKDLTEKEVVFNKELDAFEPCTECLEIAMDAAYCDGFQYDEETECVVLAADFDEAEGEYLTNQTWRGERDDE